ncbi:hypothetical protein GCM10027447_26790 [Glycomyces halotolerans]
MALERGRTRFAVELGVDAVEGLAEIRGGFWHGALYIGLSGVVRLSPQSVPCVRAVSMRAPDRAPRERGASAPVTGS